MITFGFAMLSSRNYSARSTNSKACGNRARTPVCSTALSPAARLVGEAVTGRRDGHQAESPNEPRSVRMLQRELQPRPQVPATEEPTSKLPEE